MNDSGQAIQSRRYFSLDDGQGGTLTYSADRDFGTEGTNYLEADYAFDPLNRSIATANPDGTVQHTFYDTLSRSVATWIGSDDVPDAVYYADGSAD